MMKKKLLTCLLSLTIINGCATTLPEPKDYRLPREEIQKVEPKEPPVILKPKPSFEMSVPNNWFYDNKSEQLSETITKVFVAQSPVNFGRVPIIVGMFGIQWELSPKEFINKIVPSDRAILHESYPIDLEGHPAIVLLEFDENEMLKIKFGVVAHGTAIIVKCQGDGKENIKNIVFDTCANIIKTLKINVNTKEFASASQTWDVY